MMKGKYPPLEDFLPPDWKPEGCGCGPKPRKPQPTKKKRTPVEPACYGVCCGAKCRDALGALHRLNTSGGAV